MMDLQIPLNRLKFGQDDGAGINARVTGREDGIAALAANLHANGQIENLIVKEAGDGFYAVANGNRRLAAFRMIFGAESSEPINCTVHDVDETKGFEFSLTTAVTARQLHPVDQYEAFAKLEERGKTNEEIARDYGMTEKEVRQALALGRLSPTIREAWRKAEIKAEVARAFTLALDHNTQDKVFAELKQDGNLWEHRVKVALGAAATDEDIRQLIDLVGADAYRARGGVLTEDLFGTSHIISDPALLQQMARDLLLEKCEALAAEGWGWVAIASDLPHGARFWQQVQPKTLVYEGDEEERITAARARLRVLEDQDVTTNEEDVEQEQLGVKIEAIEQAARARSFEAKKKKTLGCIVNVEDGRLVVLYGVRKPQEVKLRPGGGAVVEEDEPAAAKSSRKAPEEPEISNALLHRLSLQLTEATATALIQDEQLALSVLLAGFGCYDDCGVKVSVNGLAVRGGRERGVLGAERMPKALPLATALKPADRITLLAQIAANALDFQNASLDVTERDDIGPAAICNAIDAKMMNAALRGAFDAKDYFAGVSKALCIKAIEEAMGSDMARQQAKKPKTDIVAFAVENVTPTGWLPIQLRVKGYDGPPKAKGGKPTADKASTRETIRKAKAARDAKKAIVTAKRAAKAKTKRRR
jgi:ParB family transcriptional regulator, chromosome partitioning protein